MYQEENAIGKRHLLRAHHGWARSRDFFDFQGSRTPFCLIFNAAYFGMLR